MDPQVATELSQAAAATIAVARLISLRLATAFPALLVYLLFDAFYSYIYALISPKSGIYFWVYVSVAPLLSVISIFAVRELVTLIFQNYPGIRTLGRWVIYGSVTFAASISLAAAKLINIGYPHKKWGLYYIQSVERSVIFSLAIAIVAILFVLSKYPLHLGRNTYVSSGFFGALFLSDAVRLLIDSLAPQFFNHYVDWTEAFIITACLAGWALMLRRQPAPVARVAFSSPDEDRLLQQLESLNQIMTRAARR
ncbi:MAG TPA: hypothetical protein VK789_30740 [Bryobacteraceae bacterium]|jgi:hypothetical protein|nr:hypothetical protein [Bryobacteraceae bacterium]